jgi:alpha-1,2-mannosyltransferase
MIGRPPRPFWRFTAAEARMHAMIAATAMGAVVIATLTLGTTYRDPFGHVKWADFVHFYTLGHIAQDGPPSELYDVEAQYRRQLAILPASAGHHYLPVYPPQTALIFAPLARLPYLTAGFVWALVSIAAFAIAVWLAWRPARLALDRSSLVAAAAAAFPPLWSLVLNGQTTAVPIVAFAAGTHALVRGRRLLAGLALGLLFVKPQFGLVLAVVTVACREWAILGGLALSGAAQAAAVVGLLGRAALEDYLHVLTRLTTMRTLLEPRIDQMHSIAAVTRLLPGPLEFAAWFLSSAIACWAVVRVWRSAVPVVVHAAALVLGSVLVNPHVNSYDVAVIGPALVALTGWVEGQDERWEATRHQWRLALYVLYAALLLPTATLIGVQLSPFVLLFMLAAIWHVASASESRAQLEPRRPAPPRFTNQDAVEAAAACAQSISRERPAAARLP